LCRRLTSGERAFQIKAEQGMLRASITEEREAGSDGAMKGAAGRRVGAQAPNSIHTAELAGGTATGEAVALLALVAEAGRDAELGTRVVTAAQYEELYRLHYQAILGVCVRRLQGMADAEDAVQETFVRALGHPEVFSKPAPWLARVAVRVCIDELRRRQRGDLRFAALQARAHRDVVVGDRAEVWDIAALHNLLTTLTVAERRVVACVMLRGLSHGETSHRLGITASTSRVLLSRAIKKLRQLQEPRT
jgi:RNA polymerase sigma factor (sigma-70 family)